MMKFVPAIARCLIGPLAAIVIGLPGAAGDVSANTTALKDADDLILKGEYDQAEAALRALIDRTASDASATELNWQGSVSLARVLTLQSRYTDAGSLLDRVLNSIPPAITDTCMIVTALNERAEIALLLGRYAEAENLRHLVLNMSGNGCDDRSIRAEALMGLAQVKQRCRLFSISAVRGFEALHLIEQGNENETWQHARAIAVLARARRSSGTYEEADTLYQQALQMAVDILGPDHPAIAGFCSNLAALYVNMREPLKAEGYAKRSLSIAMRKLGPDHVEVGWAKYHLANSHALSDRPASADSLYHQALDILILRLGRNNPDLANVHAYHGFAHRLRGEFDEAFTEAVRAYEIRMESYVRNAGHLKDYDAILFAQTIHYDVSDVIAYYFDLPQKSAEQTALVADAILTSKGIALDDLLLRRRLIADDPDSSMQSLWEMVENARFMKSQLYARDPQQIDRSTIQQLRSLADSEEQFLRLLAPRIGARRDSALSRFVAVEDLATVLSPSSCLVEFFSFLYVHPSLVYGEETHYGALVIDHTGALDLVEFPIRYTSAPFLSRLRDLMDSVQEQSPAHRAALLRTIDSVASDMYSQIWGPIEEATAGYPDLLISPDDLFTSVPFAALKSDNGRYLIEDHTIHYIDSGRDLLRRQGSDGAGNGLFALGDPDFDATPDDRLRLIQSMPETTVLAAAPTRNVRSLCEELESLQVGSLPGTRREVTRLIDDWKATSEQPVNSYLGAAACEEVVKSVAPGRAIVHLATHGFYMPEFCGRPGMIDTDWKEFESPLLHSGLLFAGANLKDRIGLSEPVEDGVLTAEEVSAMSFEGTDLVVLSACETGRGIWMRGQGGGFGIRRAFLMAGARSVISSMWQVSDQVTTSLMTRIYRPSSRSYAELIREYAIEQINAARSAGKQPDPSDWAAFTVSGECNR